MLNACELEIDLFCKGLRVPPEVPLGSARGVSRTRAGLGSGLELALPRETPASVVAERVRLFHEAAARLPFDTVSALVQATAGEALGDVNIFNCTLEEFFRLGARSRLDPRDEDTGKRVDRLTSTSFTVTRRSWRCSRRRSAWASM